MSSDVLTGIFKSIQFYYHIKEEGKERKDLEYRFQSRDNSGDIKRQTQGIVWSCKPSMVLQGKGQNITRIAAINQQ